MGAKETARFGQLTAPSARFLLALIFEPEDLCDMFLQNVGLESLRSSIHNLNKSSFVIFTSVMILVALFWVMTS